MDDCRSRTLEALETCPDQVFTALCKNLDDHVVGHPVRLYQALDKVELRCACAREADLDFLDPNAHEFIKEAVFLHRIHRIYDRLVAITQIG